MRISSTLVTLWAFMATRVVSLDIKMGDESSMKDGLSKIAKGLMDYYQGDKKGGTPGMMVDPYYWWEAGAAWNSILDYWYYTGDDTYNDVLKKALLFQTGQNNDYMPSNQTTTEGNDDQGFWGITAMAAAERKFSNPKSDQPQWLALAQAVFNTMSTRWDTRHCGGGLRWQIYTWNSGYDYKNSVSNGCMFNIASRLYRYTGNKTYSEWADKIWDWAEKHGYLEEDKGITVYDGGYIHDDCKNVSSIQWTYNNGLFLSGAAAMYNKTEDNKWLKRTQGLWEGASVFWKNDILYEAACQPSNQCKTDQRCFKGIFARFCGLTAQMVPTMGKDIVEKLSSAGDAAAKSCSGGSDGHTCGLNWFKNGWDGVFGLGEEMSALEVMQNTLALQKPGPVTNDTGGTSKGDANAGTRGDTEKFKQNKIDVKGKDRAGAGILTTVVIGWLLGTAFWMLK